MGGSEKLRCDIYLIDSRGVGPHTRFIIIINISLQLRDNRMEEVKKEKDSIARRIGSEYLEG